MIRTEVTLTQTGNNAQSRYTTYDCVKRLPQFYNVLNGTMTDWPQADRARERAKYGSVIDKLLSVKPGLGGA